MILYLLRHGQTDWNIGFRIQGRTDIPLNDTGIAQAEQAAERLRGLELHRIYASPLKRALQTALIVNRGRDLDLITDDRLMELDFGRMEGKGPEECTGSNRDAFFSDPANYVPEGGESFEELDARCRSFLSDLRRREKADARILISAHGALIKGLLRAMEDKPVSAFWDTPPQPNCAALTVIEEGGHYTVGDLIMPDGSIPETIERYR